MKFEIDPSVLELFPQVKLGVLIAIDLDQSNNCLPLVDLLRAAERGVLESYQLETLSTVPKIADWREAYRTFGVKPSSCRSSIEALIRRVLQGKELPSINPIVDAYNIVSLENVLPVGGDDIDRVDGRIILTRAEGSEHFVMLGSDKAEEIKTGEVIYRDDREVLCRSWNYRECEKSKITPDTKNVCLVVEGLDHTSKEEVFRALLRLKHLLTPMCKGALQEFYLCKENPEIDF